METGKVLIKKLLNIELKIVIYQLKAFVSLNVLIF